MLTLGNVRIVTPQEVIEPGAVVIGDDGCLAYAGPAADTPAVTGERLDLDGHIVTPGLIDIHTHGGHGVTFGRGFAPGAEDALAAELWDYAAWAATTGVTGFLCSVAAPDAAALRDLVAAYAAIFEAGPGAAGGARPLGLHLEGPYLNPDKRGAFNAAWLRDPVLCEVRTLLDLGRGWIRQMTLAPELPFAGEVAVLLREAGVMASLGHSNTDYATASAALRGSFGHVTHTFNAQRGFHHREPGVLGAVLASDDVSAELIADTVHVHPAAMKVLLRCLGPDRVVLVTDAMAAAGLGDGRYELVGHEVIVEEGQARQADGTIAGSTATLDLCLRKMVGEVGVPLREAVQMATANPARVLGMEETLGLLAAGREATLVVLDPDLEVAMTVIEGKVVYP
jgi:N-acetylglucosamine-6-phosphate deacetylase